jgi:hypothetical protein
MWDPYTIVGWIGLGLAALAIAFGLGCRTGRR